MKHKAAKTSEDAMTTLVELFSSSRVGQVTFFISFTISSYSLIIFVFMWTFGLFKHAGRESNPQPAVLETAALPIKLPAYSFLLSLFVNYRLITPAAIFLIFYSGRMLALVLRCRVISSLTLSTFQGDYISHVSTFIKKCGADDRD
jgi:hypothetical protein